MRNPHVVSTTSPVHPASAQRWRRAFPGELDQARAARRFTAALPADRPDLDEVLLAVDELVVSALRHTKSGQPGGTFIVEIAHWDGAVTVAVTDEGAPSEPAVTMRPTTPSPVGACAPSPFSRPAGAGSATTVPAPWPRSSPRP
ncbi:ATP-binding protein [Actinomadura sp. 7K534]|uniref:ATP-binding protein n=1 Tax=Actinomadura sp. 7K534 TaxID=2530366 RepID=UPI001FB7081F|nr:ATP-binding protein [Actinomadura sp. 7K534]